MTHQRRLLHVVRRTSTKNPAKTMEHLGGVESRRDGRHLGGTRSLPYVASVVKLTHDKSHSLHRSAIAAADASLVSQAVT